MIAAACTPCILGTLKVGATAFAGAIGYSKVRDTPRKRNVIKGMHINVAKEIVVEGNCFPNCSLCLVA